MPLGLALVRNFKALMWFSEDVLRVFKVHNMVFSCTDHTRRSDVIILIRQMSPLSIYIATWFSLGSGNSIQSLFGQVSNMC